SVAADCRLAERNHVVGSRVLTLVVGLPVEVLVLQEQDGGVASNRGSQKAGRITRVGGEDDTNAGAVRKDAFARLAVIRGAPPEVSTDRRPDHHGTGERVVRSIS